MVLITPYAVDHLTGAAWIFFGGYSNLPLSTKKPVIRGMDDGVDWPVHDFPLILDLQFTGTFNNGLIILWCPYAMNIILCQYFSPRRRKRIRSQQHHIGKSPSGGITRPDWRVVLLCKDRRHRTEGDHAIHRTLLPRAGDLFATPFQTLIINNKIFRNHLVVDTVLSQAKFGL